MDGLWHNIKQNKSLILLLQVGAVFFFLRYLTPLLAPILAAMLFVTIFGPLLQRLQKLHLRRPVGALILLVLAGAVLALVLWLLIRWGMQGFPRIQEQGEAWRRQLPGWAAVWLDWALSEISAGAADFQKLLFGGAIKYAGRLAALGGSLATFLIAVLLLAKDYDELMNRLLDREDCHLLLSVLCNVIRYVATYVKAQCVIMTMIAGLCALVLSLSGIPQGPLFGLLAGVMDALPFIGTGVVLVPLGTFWALQGRLVRAAVCGVLYLACIFLRELAEPRLIGKKLGIRPILVLISLYVGIRLFGIAGIIKGPLGFIILWETQRYGSEGTV